MHRECVKSEGHLVQKHVLFDFIYQKSTFRFVLPQGCVNSEGHLVQRQVLFDFNYLKSMRATKGDRRRHPISDKFVLHQGCVKSEGHYCKNQQCFDLSVKKAPSNLFCIRHLRNKRAIKFCCRRKCSLLILFVNKA